MDTEEILNFLCSATFSRSCSVHSNNLCLESTQAIKSINVVLQLDNNSQTCLIEKRSVVALLSALLKLIECNYPQNICACINQAHLFAALVLKNVVIKRWSIHMPLAEDEKFKICQFFLSNSYLLAIRTDSLNMKSCIQLACTCAMIFAYECNNASSNDIFTLNFALQWLKSCQEDLAALLCDSHTTVNLVSRCKGLAATLFVVKETLSKKSVSKLLTNETKWKFPIQQLHNLLIYQISAVQSLILDLVNTASDKYGGIVNASHAICSLTVCSVLSVQVVTLCPFIPESVDALLHSNGLPLHLRLLQECFQTLKNYSRNSKPETNALSHIQKTHIFQLFALIVEDEVDDSFSVTMDCRNTSEIFACKAMLATNIRSLISIPGQLLKLDNQKILPLLAPMLQFCVGVIEQYNIIEDSDSIDSGLNKEVATSAVLLLSDVVKTLTVTNAAATNTDEIIPFFSSDRIEMLLKNLLEKLLVIDRAELDHWGKDPHQFFADQIMLTEGVCVRAAAEGLFYGLLELYPDYLTNTMLTLLGNNREQIDLATVAQKELGCNTVVGVWVSFIFDEYFFEERYRSLCFANVL